MASLLGGKNEKKFYLFHVSINHVVIVDVLLNSFGIEQNARFRKFIDQNGKSKTRQGNDNQRWLCIQ